MIVTKMKIANLRAIGQAEFTFKPGFNLIVGINGVGKTSVLETLNVCLSAVTRNANNLPNRSKGFKDDDIRVGAGYLTIECNVHIDERDFSYYIQRPLGVKSDNGNETTNINSKVIKKTKQSKFIGEAPSFLKRKVSTQRPVAMFFSTNRAVPTDKKISNKILEKGGMSVVYANVFSNRELRLADFADWMAAQLVIAKDSPARQHILDACQGIVSQLLPGYSNLHVKHSDSKQLWIDHGQISIPIRQLSDGERGILALVLDMTRWLAQANPDLSDPARESEAVILIDEIDLHLHPKWQRDIVRNLCLAFPKCQFIATTHSPQIIGEVEHDMIQIISDGMVYQPPYSFGVDSSRVLEEIMDVDSRSSEVESLLKDINSAIDERNFAFSRTLLVKIIERIGDNDPEVTKLRTLLDFLEGKP